jgi:hypothetical protein
MAEYAMTLRSYNIYILLHHSYTLIDKKIKRKNLKSEIISWALVVHACHSRCLGGWDWEDCGSRSAWTKKLVRPHLYQRLGTVAWTCNPNLFWRPRAGGSQSQVSPGKKVSEIPSQQEKKLDVMACVCHPSNSKYKTGRSWSRLAWAKSWSCSSSVEHLPSKSEALNSKPQYN